MKRHKHVIIRAVVADPITDCFSAVCLLKDIISGIKMEVLIPPVAEYCHEPDNEGVTAFAVITTSHIAMHIWDKDNVVQLDVYSCREFDPEVVFSLLDRYMDIVKVSSALILRDDEVTAEKIDFRT